MFNDNRKQIMNRETALLIKSTLQFDDRFGEGLQIIVESLYENDDEEDRSDTSEYAHVKKHCKQLDEVAQLINPLLNDDEKVTFKHGSAINLFNHIMGE